MKISELIECLEFLPDHELPVYYRESIANDGTHKLGAVEDITILTVRVEEGLKKIVVIHEKSETKN